MILSDEEKQVIDDFKNTFATDTGRRVYEYIRELSCFDDEIVPGEGSHPYQMCAVLGSRDLFRRIKEKVEFDMSQIEEEEQE